MDPQDTIRNFLKFRCLKCVHIFHLYMICMNYDQKKGQKSLESRGQMRSDWACYTPLERYFWKLSNITLAFFLKTWFEKDMNNHNFRTIKVPVLGLSLSNPEKKWHLDVVPVEKHIIHYRTGSGASSQRLWAV